jgi:hypothetical protein
VFTPHHASGDHKSRLFTWQVPPAPQQLPTTHLPLKPSRILDKQRDAIKSTTPHPFMLLLPAWTLKWLPWRTFLWALARLRKGCLEVH